MMTLETLTPEVIELFKFLNNNKKSLDRLTVDELIKNLIDEKIWSGDIRLLIVDTKPHLSCGCKFLTMYGNKLYSDYIKYKAHEILNSNLKGYTKLLHDFVFCSKIKLLCDEARIKKLQQDAKLFNTLKNAFEESYSRNFEEVTGEHVDLSYDNIKLIELFIDETNLYCITTDICNAMREQTIIIYATHLLNTINIELITLLSGIKCNHVEVYDETLTAQDVVNITQLKELNLIDDDDDEITDLGDKLLELYRQNYLKSINESSFNIFEKIAEIGNSIGCSFELDDGGDDDTVIRFFDDKNVCVYEERCHC